MAENNRQAKGKLPDEGLFPIRTVSSVTGVNPVTLRAWERRYKLIVPKRTPKGHRLYSREQIDAIRRVVELLDRGISISQVKPLLEREEDTAPLTDTVSADVSADTWKPITRDALDAVAAYDGQQLDKLYDDALSLFQESTVTDKLTLATQTSIENRSKTDSVGVTQLRFFTAYIRNRLGARLMQLNKDNKGPALVVTCAPGEQDEIGALIFTQAASAVGHRIVYLGADVGFEEIPEAVERSKAAGAVISATRKPRGKVLTEFLPDLVTQLEEPVFLGGRLAYTHEKQIKASGASSIGTLSSMAEISHAIRVIDRKLTP